MARKATTSRQTKTAKSTKKKAAASTKSSAATTKAAKTKADAAPKTTKSTKTTKKTAAAASKPKATSKPKAAPVADSPADSVNGNGQKFTDDQLRKVKTGLTKRDLERFKRLLLEKRAELIGDVTSLETGNKDGGNLSSMPLHMADIGSDNYEQEFTQGLLASERKLLYQIDEALIRLQTGTYGVCIESAEPIGKPRLEAKPWAKYTIAVARERERLGKDD